MKKIQITLEDLFNLPTAIIYNPDDYKSVRNVSIDSRTIKKNSLFIAIKGEKFDGHDFVVDAVNNGASALLISEKKLKQFDKIDLPIITVKDTTIAYGQLANIWRHKLSAKVVSLTGSNGKTTTKEMIATLLGVKYKVVKTEANNNNHIGVPLTIFNADAKTEILVLEQGTNHFNEITYSAKISEPDFALITNIGDSHLEFLIDRDGVYNEKSALLKAADKRGGKVLLNTDDAIIRKHKKEYKNIITYGFKGKVDIKGKLVNHNNDGTPFIEVNGKNKKINTSLPVYGELNAKNYLSAVTVALTLGLTKNEILEGAKKLKAAKGRFQVKDYKNFMLIDDTYNSNPDSVKAALNILKRIKTYNKKIVVLGDMYELGKNENKIHAELNEPIKKAKVNAIYTIGKMMKNLDSAIDDPKIDKKHFPRRDSLKKFLRQIDLDDCVILFKGSRGMKMEDFVEVIKQRVN